VQNKNIFKMGEEKGSKRWWKSVIMSKGNGKKDRKKTPNIHFAFSPRSGGKYGIGFRV
jgi:hypothetical protein